MDEPHGAATTVGSPAEDSAPRSDDERFIVGLVLSYYRRHPDRARMHLLELLGEALAPQLAAPVAAPAGQGDMLGQRARSGVAPLKRRR